MPGHSGLPRENHIIPQLGTPRDADLRNNQTMFADDDVMGDLHEIVDLRAPANPRRPQRPAINRHIRADLHVVADDHLPDLRHFAVGAVVQHVAIAVGTNHRPGVKARAPANFRARIQGDVRKQPGLLAQQAIVAHKIAALQNRFRPDARAFADGAMRSNVRRGIHLRRRRHNGAGMDAGGKNGLGKEQGERFGKGDARMLDANNDLAGRVEPRIGNDGGGGALFGQGKERFVFGKGEVARLGAVGGGESGQAGGGIALHLT